MQKTPVNEAEFAFDDRTPLSLYDCALPKLKQHRKRKFDPRKFLMYALDDNEAKARVVAIERETQQFKLHEV